MKRQLSIFASLLLVAVMMLALASCDLFGQKHEHEYAKDWSTDATHHWYAATCKDNAECKSAVKDKAAHKFDANNVCSVCKYEGPKAGTIGNPNDLTVPGEVKVAFAEGAKAVWYTFTAADDAILRVTVSDNAKMAYGVDKNAIYDVDGTSAEITIKKDRKYYITVATKDGKAGEIAVKTAYVQPGEMGNPKPLTIPGAFELAYEPDAKNNPIWYTFVAAETTKLGVTLGANTTMGYGMRTDDMTYTEDGQTYVDIIITEGTTYYVNFSTTNFEKGNVTANSVYIDPIKVGDISGTYLGIGQDGVLTVYITSNEKLDGGTVKYVRESNGDKYIEEYAYKVALEMGYDECVVLYDETGKVAEDTIYTDLKVVESVPTVARRNGNDYTLTNVGTMQETGYEGYYTLTSPATATLTAANVTVRIIGSVVMLETSVNKLPVNVTVSYTIVNNVFTLDADNTEVKNNGLALDFNDDKTLKSVTWSGRTYSDVKVAVDPNGTEDSPYVIEQFPTTEEAADSGSKQIWYSFVAPETGVVTVTFPNINSYAWLYSTDTETHNYSQTYYERTEMLFLVVKDVEYKIALGAWVDDENTVGKYFNVEITFKAGAVAKGDFENPYGFDNYNNETYKSEAQVTFAANYEAGKYAWIAMSGYGYDATYTFNFNVNVDVQYYADGELKTVTNVNTVSIFIEGIGNSDVCVAIRPTDTTAEVTVVATYDDPAAALGTENNPFVDVDIFDEDGIAAEGNSFGNKWYEFTATADGYLTINYADNANANITIYNSDYETLVGTLTENGYKFIVYKDAEYKIALGVKKPGAEDITVNASFDATTVPYPGDREFPVEISWNTKPVNFAETTDSNKWVYYTYKRDNLGTVTFTFESAVKAKFGADLNNLSEVATNTVFTYNVEPGVVYYFLVQTTDLSAATITFTNEFTYAPGTDSSNPKPVVADGTTNNTHSVDENKDGYFAYNPTDYGTITITVTSTNPDAYVGYYKPKEYSLTKLYNGDSATIDVEPGEALELILSTGVDYNEEAPEETAADISFTAKFVKGEAPAQNLLAIGVTNVTATTQTMTEPGAEYIFTAADAGEYVLVYNEAVGVVNIIARGNVQTILSGHTFTLAAGQSASFYMATAFWLEPTVTQYAVAIAKVETTENVTVAFEGVAENNSWNSDVMDSYQQGSEYIIEVQYSDIIVASDNCYYFISYEITDNLIGITWGQNEESQDYDGALTDALFVYVDGSIIALLTDGTAITFTAASAGPGGML